MDIEKVVEDFSNNLTKTKAGRVTAKVTKVTKQFKITEVSLEISRPGDNLDYMVFVTIYERQNGKKRFDVSGDHDLEVWADIMKYIKSV